MGVVCCFHGNQGVAGVVFCSCAVTSRANTPPRKRLFALKDCRNSRTSTSVKLVSFLMSIHWNVCLSDLNRFFVLSL